MKLECSKKHYSHSEGFFFIEVIDIFIFMHSLKQHVIFRSP